MLAAFFKSRKWVWWAYGGGLIVFISLYAQVHMLVLINDWYGGFYNMLQEATKHSLTEFWDKIWTFFSIAFPYVFLATITNYFTRLYVLRWREAITFSYIPRWRNVTVEIEGASQRIQEDAYRFARIMENIGLQIVRAIMTLVSFTPILWMLSSATYSEFLKDIPGSLVWLAVTTSFGGTIISWFVGTKLPGLEYNNQKVEAAFRKELVYGEDDKENYAAQPLLVELFTGIRFNYHRLFLHYGYFDIWSISYSQLMVMVPYIVAGPSLFSGAIMLGVLMQVINAFGKVNDSFSVFIDNWTTVTELRSIWKRLHEFEANLDRHQNIRP